MSGCSRATTRQELQKVSLTSKSAGANEPKSKLPRESVTALLLSSNSNRHSDDSDLPGIFLAVAVQVTKHAALNMPAMEPQQS